MDHARTTLARFVRSAARALPALAVGWAASSPLAAQGSFTLNVGGTINSYSDGLLSGPSSANNGGLTMNYPYGFFFPVQHIVIQGVVSADGVDLSVSPPNQLRILVERLSSTNVVLAAWSPGVLNGSAVPLDTSGAIAIGPAAYPGASALGTLAPGEKIRVRLFETVDGDDGFGQYDYPDAYWNELTVKIVRRPGGVIFDGFFNAVAFEGGTPMAGVGTGGSDYETHLGLYSDEGALIDDDSGGGGLPAYISLDGLPPGEYYLCCIGAGPGGGFGDGFEVTLNALGAGGGTLVMNLPDGTSETHATRMDSVVWYVIRVEWPRCQGDTNGDDVVDFADFSKVLANYGDTCDSPTP